MQQNRKGRGKSSNLPSLPYLWGEKNHQRLNDLYEMLFRYRETSTISEVVHGNLCSSCTEVVSIVTLGSDGISYQRLLPPRGAELEEVKPPTSDLVSSISRWNRGLREQFHLPRPPPRPPRNPPPPPPYLPPPPPPPP